MPSIDSFFLDNLQDNYTKYPCFIETGTYNGDTIFSFIYEDNGGVNGISLNNIVFDEKFMVIRIKKGTY